MKNKLAIIITAVWAIAIGVGTVWITDFSTGPGRTGDSPAVLPSVYLNENTTNLPKLFVFLHPYCQCSRATLAELSRLAERNMDLMEIHIFIVPLSDQSTESNSFDFEKKASEIPNAKLSTIGESEIKEFGAVTSGQTLLYDRQGNLVFSGGITRARGHEGDNFGSENIEEYLHGRDIPFVQTPVFGCLLTASE